MIGYAIGVTTILVLLGLLVHYKRAWFLGLLRRRIPVSQGQITAAAPATGGRLSKISPVKWFFIGLLGWLLYSIGSCIYSLPGQIDETSRGIAKEGREWQEALSEVARKATSPAETQQKLPKEEPEETPSPLSRVEMVDWCMRNGPAAGDSWKEIGTELDYHSSGKVGLEPVINTAFWEGYSLKITPLYGMEELLGSAFTSTSTLSKLISNDDDYVTLGGNVSRSMPISRDTGLVWLRTQAISSSRQKSGKEFGFTAQVVEPEDNPYLVRRKQGSVRFAYQREFRPMAGKALSVRCCTLPFQMIGQTAGATVTVPVDFDIDVTLARLPKPGETTVAEMRPNPQDLDKPLVMLELVCDETVVYERHIDKWHVRLSSDKDIRPYLGDPRKYPRGELRFKCGMPVGVHVAIQIGGTRR